MNGRREGERLRLQSFDQWGVLELLMSTGESLILLDRAALLFHCALSLAWSSHMFYGLGMNMEVESEEQLLGQCQLCFP